MHVLNNSYELATTYLQVFLLWLGVLSSFSASMLLAN